MIDPITMDKSNTFTAMLQLHPRHIQNMSEATSLQKHWGYFDRAIPCTNDRGSCEYLDVVYHSHDLGILYCGIIWATLLGCLFLWAIFHRSSAGGRSPSQEISKDEEAVNAFRKLNRFKTSLDSYRRSYLLPEFAQPIFGRTTRTQILILAVLSAYLATFTFVGITYNTWITPVKKMPGVYNSRTSLGPWADRVGVIAYALTPLSVLLSSRESLLSLITGLPYQSFNFLHRWLGYIILVQASLHTIGWCVIETRLYQPQPSVSIEWVKQLYMIWGVIAMFLLSVLFLLSTPWAIRKTGYEFFRKAHYILAMLYIGACWGHWSKLSCYLIPSLVVWLIDRGVRLVRTALLHYGYVNGEASMEFRTICANISAFPDSLNGDVVRLDFVHPQDPWAIGQHFYLCFSSLSIWQSHPFTPLNVPTLMPNGVQHSYVLRAKRGETARLAKLAASQRAISAVDSTEKSQIIATVPIILNGPYGVSEVDGLTSQTNVLCVAGGTGITFVLPVLLSQVTKRDCSLSRKLRLVWAIRKQADMAWLQPELDKLYEAAKSNDLQISIYVTRERVLDVTRECKDNIDISQVSLPSNTSTSRSCIETKIEPMNSCCPKGTVLSVTAAGAMADSDDVALCSPSAPHDQSLTIERRADHESTAIQSRHPDLQIIVQDFVENTIGGPTTIYASGPGGMISDLRRIVAGVNDGKKVWKGDERWCVELKCDDRLEW